MGAKKQHLEDKFLPSYLKEIIDSPSVTVSLLDAALWVGDFLAPLPASYRGQWNECVLTLLQLVNCHLIRRVRVFFPNAHLDVEVYGCFRKWWYPHFTPQNEHL